MLQPKFDPFPELQTNRLLLRRMIKADAPQVLQLRSDEKVMRYIDRKRADTLTDAEQWLQIIDDAIDNNTGITWGISMKDSPGVLIGSVGYWRLIKEHYRAEVGYMLNASLWRNGIMKEALNKIIEYGFDQFRLHSIEAHINTANSASAGLLTAMGFIQEAYFKENYFFEGTFRDTIVYSLLKSKAYKK